MAVIDANLLFARLILDYFTKIFGNSKKEGLDIDASRSEFSKLASEINAERWMRFSMGEPSCF